MNKEELIKFLKENLKIVLTNTSGCRGVGSDYENRLEATIYLGDEEISSSEEYLPD